MEKIAIITGGSKGIGNGLVKEYHKNGYRVISISRTLLDKFYAAEQYQCDLSKIDTIEPMLKEMFSHLDPKTTKRILLINNAGDLGVVNTIDNIDPEDISYTLRLNLTVPMILNSLFIKYLRDWECKKKIINISSGAAVNPYASWGMYCSSKAGVDMMTKVISKEQKKIKNGVSIVSVYPGVVDTDMQAIARNTPKEQFKSVQRFIDFHKYGELKSKEQVAEKIYLLDHSGKLKKGKITDIRNH